MPKPMHFDVFKRQSDKEYERLAYARKIGQEIDADRARAEGEEIRKDMCAEARLIYRAMGLSRKEFSKKFNIPLSTLRSWEREVHCPSKRSMDRLRVIGNTMSSAVELAVYYTGKRLERFYRRMRSRAKGPYSVREPMVAVAMAQGYAEAKIRQSEQFFRKAEQQERKHRDKEKK